MLYAKKKPFMNIFLGPLVIMGLSSSLAYSLPNDTILSSSIKWDDEVSRAQLLETVPKWNNDEIKSLFDVYIHPLRYQMDNLSDTKQYNVQFIHAFWGPLANPFNKYPRPAKAFVLLNDNANKNTFYLAPIIKNVTDNAYYIFDKDQAQPMLLNDWVASIKNTAGNKALIQFNICDGYGNLPADSCSGKSYQSEARFIGPTAKENSVKAKTIPSAHREFYEDWHIHVKTGPRLTNELDGSIYASSVAWQKVDERNLRLNTVETWPNYQIIKANFEKIRDMRYFRDEKKSGFFRRISWLYPDDGCWTRASAVIKDLFGPFNNIANDYSRPSKVFAFGNLCTNTSNSPTGKVSWWYHTAPIIRDAETNQTYVLDPSVDPYSPSPVEKWMDDISSQSGACTGSGGNVNIFNVCTGYGVSPFDQCQDDDIDFSTEIRGMLGQSTYQNYERQRQLQLGRDADKVLGDLPPWKNAAH